MATVTISDSGGGGTVSLIDGSAPAPIPVVFGQRRVSTHVMSPGSSGAGLRVVQDLGFDRSYSDIEFTVRRVTQSELDSLTSKFETDPAATFEYSPDGGTTVFSVCWMSDGLVPVRWQAKEDYYSVTIKFHVLSQIAP